jgi:hypothetical protein
MIRACVPSGRGVRCIFHPLLADDSLPRPPGSPGVGAGSDTLRLVTAARAAVDEDIRAWETLSRTTDFAEGAQL